LTLLKFGRTRIIRCHEVGELELNRNPENYLREVEQAAFEPRNVVPGMDFRRTKCCKPRLISYPDAHRYRPRRQLRSLPVNKPQCPYHTYNKDGAMRFDGNGGPQGELRTQQLWRSGTRSQIRRAAKMVGGTVARHDHRQRQ